MLLHSSIKHVCYLTFGVADLYTNQRCLLVIFAATEACKTKPSGLANLAAAAMP
jgi:hypothetical protein